MNLLDIHYFGDYRGVRGEIHVFLQSVKGFNEKAIYMKKFNIYNVIVLAIWNRNKRAKEDQNQVVNLRPFYIIN